MHGGPQFRASVIAKLLSSTIASSSGTGARKRKSPSGGLAYGIPPKNVTGLLISPVGEVEFPTKAAYPRLTTGPRGEETLGIAEHLISAAAKKKRLIREGLIRRLEATRPTLPHSPSLDALYKLCLHGTSSFVSCRVL